MRSCTVWSSKGLAISQYAFSSREVHNMRLRSYLFPFQRRRAWSNCEAHTGVEKLWSTYNSTWFWDGSWRPCAKQLGWRRQWGRELCRSSLSLASPFLHSICLLKENCGICNEYKVLCTFLSMNEFCTVIEIGLEDCPSADMKSIQWLRWVLKIAHLLTCNLASLSHSLPQYLLVRTISTLK